MQRARRTSRLTSLLKAALAVSVLTASASAQVISRQTTTTTVYTPITGGQWFNTAVNAPVTILNQNQIGVWQRGVQYRITQTERIIRSRYSSYYNWFIASGARPLSDTTQPGPLNNTTVWITQTVMCTSSDAPPAALPAAFQRRWISKIVERALRGGEVELTDAAGGAHIAFALAGEATELPEFDPMSDTFESICGILSPGYDAAAMAFDAAAMEFAALPDAPDGLEADFSMHYAGLAGAFGATAGALGDASSGVPLLDPLTLDELAFQLAAMADLFDAAGLVDYADARAHLDAASDAAADAATLIATDLYSPVDPRVIERTLFLGAFAEISEHLRAFGDALAASTTDVCLADLTTSGLCAAGSPDGVVDLSDFSCFLSEWASDSPMADVSVTGLCTPGNTDDVVDLSDFSCYLSLWATGCP